MTVLQEILEWSQDRPAWQRDALRRLVLYGELSDDDLRALATRSRQIQCPQSLLGSMTVRAMTKKRELRPRR